MFAVKASRFITHVKRLKDCEEPLETFLGRARLLGEALGPVLYQLPPNFHYKPENVDRLADFLALLPRDMRHVFEFRHDSWFNADLFSLLRIHNVGFCAFHMAGWETPLEATTDFAYVRFHGSRRRLRRFLQPGRPGDLGRPPARPAGGRARSLRLLQQRHRRLCRRECEDADRVHHAFRPQG